MSENKIRTVIRMKPEMVESMDALLLRDNCRSRNEFICKAVDFYSGYLQTKQATGYLSQTLLSQINGTLHLMESRICGTIFKLAVELAISMNVIAAMADVDGETLRKLRIKCRDDVKKSLGSVQYDRIYSAQNKIQEDEL